MNQPPGKTKLHRAARYVLAGDETAAYGILASIVDTAMKESGLSADFHLAAIETMALGALSMEVQKMINDAVDEPAFPVKPRCTPAAAAKFADVRRSLSRIGEEE